MQSYVTQTAINFHNTFENRDIIHREVTNAQFSLDPSLIWKLLCLFIAFYILTSV
jgi:hypothetical protein